jgi:hypothetical protein
MNTAILLALLASFMAGLPGKAVCKTIPTVDVDQSTALKFSRSVYSVGAVLQSADRIITISVPSDGLPHTISSLVKQSATIDGLQYDSIRLLSDDRCLFTTPSTVFVLGGGLPTSTPIGPPQTIKDVACALDSGGKM